MAKKNTLAAGTSPFAHLLGGAAALAGRALGKQAEDETRDDDAEDDSDDADAEDDSDKPEGKRGGKADDDDEDDADAEDDDDDADAEDDDADEPKGKKAATGFQRGYAAANKRASAIFLSPAAAGRPDVAAQLAFGTSMSAAEAIGVLGTVGATGGKQRGRLDDRMGSRTDPRPGSGSGKTGEASFADQMQAAQKKAGR